MAKGVKFVVPNMAETFGELEYAGEGDVIRRRVNGKSTVMARTYNLYSEKQPADDVVVQLPALAGEKVFDYEQVIKLVNPRLEAEGYKIGERAFTKYVLKAKDMLKG